MHTSCYINTLTINPVMSKRELELERRNKRLEQEVIFLKVFILSPIEFTQWFDI